MPIKFRCEHCRQLLGISRTKAGKMVDCPTCGRAVRVPSLDGKSDPVSIPNWDPQDESLVNALGALASLTEGPDSGDGTDAREDLSHEETSSSDENAPGSNPPQKPTTAPVATAIPEPIDMPPLETPVVLPEPTNSPTPPAPSPTAEPDTTHEPWSKLATLSDAAPPRDSRPGSRSSESSSMAYRPGKGVTLPIALLLVAMAFLLGYFVGNARHYSPSSGSQKIATAVPSQEPKASPPEQQARSTELPRRRAVEGRITYLSAAGSSQSDTGAVVILLPAYRNSSTRLPIVGFRPADSSEDREIAKAMMKALGGDLAVVDEEGLYSCDLPQAGEYHLIILSRHLERGESESLEPATRTMLGEYFDRPQQLVGQLKFHVSEVNYRGETTEIRDHSFGRES